jgi:membrane protein
MARAAPRARAVRRRTPPTLLAGRPILHKLLADRCTQLAAMLAYYALLSLLPLLFLAFSMLALFGRAEESSALIRQLQHVVPGQSVDGIVSTVRQLQRNAAELGIVGAIGLIWGSLGFLGALESALNIVFGVPNRPFVRQKAYLFGLVAAGLVLVWASLIVTTTAHALIERHSTHVLYVGATQFAVALASSVTITFLFLLAAYRLLPNTSLGVRDVLPGTVLATVLMQISFQALPLYLRYSSTVPALRAFGGAVVLLVWLYLMGNVVLLGAEVNWWHARGRSAPVESDEDALGHS